MRIILIVLLLLPATTAHAQPTQLGMVAAFVAVCKQRSPFYHEMTVAVKTIFNEVGMSLDTEAARAGQAVQALGCDDAELQAALESLVNHYRPPGSTKFKEHN